MSGIRFVISYGSVFLLVIIKNGETAVSNGKTAVDNGVSIFYDPGTNASLPLESLDASRLPLQPLKFISQGPPCTCSNMKCGCCAGINITSMNFNHVACTNVTIIPEEFALDFKVLLNEKEIMQNRLTARNPPPACVPVYFLPALIFCVRFFDLHYKNDRFNVCMDFETRITQWPIFVLHFNCLKIGDGGVSWVTPMGEGPKPLPTNATVPEVLKK